MNVFIRIMEISLTATIFMGMFCSFLWFLNGFYRLIIYKDIKLLEFIARWICFAIMIGIYGGICLGIF